MRLQEMMTSGTGDPQLILAQTVEDYVAAREIIFEYTSGLSFSLHFQDIQSELDHLDTFYGHPTGLIVLVMDAGSVAGVACLLNLGHFTAEIRRMYVRPAFRNRGYGKKILYFLIDKARSMGYRYLRLDTVPEMEYANRLYTSQGFYEIEDYAEIPIPGARFLEYKL